MAIPSIWRQRDNLLISAKCVSFDRWQESTGVQENQLLIGGIFHIENIGASHETAGVTFLFSGDRPTSTLDDLEILKQCRRDVEEVRFRDFRGAQWICEITTDIEVTPRPASRDVQRDNAAFTLRKKRPA